MAVLVEMEPHIFHYFFMNHSLKVIYFLSVPTFCSRILRYNSGSKANILSHFHSSSSFLDHLVHSSF